MEGFDVAQGMPATGEAAVHLEVRGILEAATIGCWASKFPPHDLVTILVDG